MKGDLDWVTLTVERILKELCEVSGDIEVLNEDSSSKLELSGL